MINFGLNRSTITSWSRFLVRHPSEFQQFPSAFQVIWMSGRSSLRDYFYLNCCKQLTRALKPERKKRKFFNTFDMLKSKH